MEQTALTKATLAAKVLDAKKAKNIEVLDVSEHTILTDLFVIAHGTSTTQVKALADEVEDKLEEAGYTAARKEGYRGASWVLLDYTDVIVHIFQKEARAFFNLEKIWADAPHVPVEGIDPAEKED